MHVSAIKRNGPCFYVSMLFATQLLIYWQADAQTATMYPPAPAYVDIRQQRTFMCKTSIQSNWRSTSFYDETNSGGVPSVGLFFKDSDGSCRISAVSYSKYNASCESTKGEYNLTVLSVDENHHNRFIRCKAQFGDGTGSDVYANARTVIYVRVPITGILISNTSITSDVTRDITIECTVMSRPAASISWIIINSEEAIQNVSLKSSNTVSSGSSGITVTSILTYRFKASENGAFLYCSADNTISSRNSSRVNLTIYYPPLYDPVIQQTPNGPINISEVVVLTCSVSGGFPLAVPTWNCSGNATNNTSGNTVYSSIGFMLVSQDNGKTCSCSATHPVTAYRPQVHIMLNVYFPPKEFPVIRQIPDGPVLTGSLVSLICTVNGGNPLATLTWNCTGMISTNASQTTATSSIELSVTKINHVMVCTCSASHNTDNYSQTVHQILNIIFPPDEIPKIRQGIPGPIDTGTSVKLICSVTGGNPLVTLSWDCLGINSNASTEIKAVLEVEFTVDKNYNGRICSCSATHPVATYRPHTEHELVVYFPPGKPNLILKHEMPWFTGNTTEVQCLSTVGNPESTFEWKTDDMVLHVNVSELTIGPLTKHDNMKTITCTVSNEYTNSQSMILTSDSIPLNVEYFPDITIDKSPVYIMEGNNATIVCNVRGNPVPKVQWFQLDHNITEPQINRSVFHLLNVDRLLDGLLYTCKAMSSSTRFGSLISENTTKAIVYYSPNITNLEVLNGQTVSENEAVTLRCEVDSNPAPTITWRFVSNQTTLQKQDDVFSSKYIIPKIKCFHMGTYQCQAANQINGTTSTDIKDIAVYVTCSPRLDTRYQGLPKIVAVEDNGDLNLTVYLIAYPTPTIRWIHNNVIDSVSTLVGNVYVSNLYLPHLKQSMFGEYTVHAYNDNGNLFLHVNVVPKGKPTPPSNVFVVCKSTSATIVWKPEFDGGDKQKFVVKYWKTSEGTNILSTTPVTDLAGQSVIKQLMSGSNYSFVVEATNIYGPSNATLIACKTDVKDIVTLKEQQKMFSDVTIATIGVAGVLFVAIVLITVFVIIPFCRRKDNSDKDGSQFLRREYLNQGRKVPVQSVINNTYDSVHLDLQYESLREDAVGSTKGNQSRPVCKKADPVHVKGTYCNEPPSPPDIKNLKRRRNEVPNHTGQHSAYANQTALADLPTGQSTVRVESMHLTEINAYEDMAKETEVKTQIKKPTVNTKSESNTQLYESMKDDRTCDKSSKSQKGKKTITNKLSDSKGNLYESMKDRACENSPKSVSWRQKKVANSTKNGTELYESMKKTTQEQNKSLESMDMYASTLKK
ncbi:muscle M-line assembly protein unc-89-like isoform X2 [Mytilus californianus]|uniref:muscle M-line assembly protein unc-89-like isoform X2 n=1 Tax=Mytilus californianus TaxID=6549 RepID=UPI002245F58B|nr:muscle M-line assembly protein unc-89-like isoform X2 [Mytilus californianus]